jgi:ribosomal-protein-serine acetyltransferase
MILARPLPAASPQRAVPMFKIDDSIALRVLRKEDARELFALTDANRDHLRAWLPWVDVVRAEADTRSFIDVTIKQREAGRGPTFAVLRDGAIVGIVGFRPIDRVNRVGEIGYWLAAGCQGRGVMTSCCRFLVRYAFLTLDLNRVEIAAAVGNGRSRAVPERLGFKLEGVLREREDLYGTYVDHAMYSQLRSEFGE